MPNVKHLLAALLAWAPCALPAQTVAPAPEDILAIYQLARDSDPSLWAQEFEVEVLRERRREDLSSLLPQLSLSGELSRTRREQKRSGFEGDPSITRNFTQERYGLNLRQALFNSPARHQVRRSDSQVDRGTAELESVRQHLVVRVAEVYLDALMAQAAVELARLEMDAIRAQRERVEGLYAERMAAITDLEEVRARHDLVRAGLIRAQGELVVAREKVSEITGVRHLSFIPLRPEARLPEPEPDDIDVWVERALAHNPDVLAATAEVAAADHGTRSARAQSYPRIDLLARYSALDDLDGTSFGRELEDLAIGVELNMPLYAGGRIGAQTRGARHARERTLQSLEAVRRSVQSDARAAFQSLASGRSEIRALEQALRSSERSLEAVDAGYQARLRPLADVLDAQSELFATRLALVRANHEYLVHVFRLRLAAGALGDEDIVELNAMLLR